MYYSTAVKLWTCERPNNYKTLLIDYDETIKYMHDLTGVKNTGHVQLDEDMQSYRT